MIICGNLDITISNEQMKKEFEVIPEGTLKEWHMFETLDHNPLLDGEFISELTGKMVAFFNKSLE
jgi:hypothetical protein